MTGTLLLSQVHNHYSVVIEKSVAGTLVNIMGLTSTENAVLQVCIGQRLSYVTPTLMFTTSHSSPLRRLRTANTETRLQATCPRGSGAKGLGYGVGV
jgi:hypothetical protein